MNNAIYGKTMENLRNRIDLKLINNEIEYLKYTSEIFDNNLVAIWTARNCGFGHIYWRNP